MTPRETDPELDELLGAYALDALDDGERRRVEEYLVTNAMASAEVDQLRETAASLSLLSDVEETAPPSLWGRIAAAIDSAGGAERARASGTERADGNEVVVLRPRRARLATWAVSAMAAAAAIAVVVLAAQNASLRGDLDEARSGDPEAVYADAASRPGAREVELAAAEQGGELARIVYLPDGTGYLLADNLAPLSRDRTYQLWALVGRGDDQLVISAGVLGNSPEAAAFKVSGPVAGFVLTVEDRGGVVSSEQPAFAVGELSI
jgi:hypothetical protein